MWYQYVVGLHLQLIHLQTDESDGTSDASVAGAQRLIIRKFIARTKSHIKHESEVRVMSSDVGVVAEWF